MVILARGSGGTTPSSESDHAIGSVALSWKKKRRKERGCQGGRGEGWRKAIILERWEEQTLPTAHFYRRAAPQPRNDGWLRLTAAFEVASSNVSSQPGAPRALPAVTQVVKLGLDPHLPGFQPCLISHAPHPEQMKLASWNGHTLPERRKNGSWSPVGTTKDHSPPWLPAKSLGSLRSDHHQSDF